MNVYSWFKLLHIVAVIVWVGGVVTLTVLGARLAREQEGAVVAALSRQVVLYGRTVIAPAAGITLIAGVATVISGRIGFATPWIVWGLTAIFLSLGLGATLIRRANEQLGDLAATAPGDPRMVALRQRAMTLNLINLLLLLSAVGAMVLKPTV